MIDYRQRDDMKRVTDIYIKEKVGFIIERLDFIGMLIVAITLPLSESLKNIGFGIALLGFLLKLCKKKGILVTYLGGGLIVLFLSGLISTLVALDKSASFKGLWDIFRYGMIFFVVANGINRKYEIKALQWGLLLSAAAGGIIEMVFISEWGKPLEILSLGQFNHTGIYIAIILSIAVSIIIFGKSLLERVLSGCIFLILLTSLILTTSRGSLVGFGASMIAILVSYKSPLKNFRSLILLLLLIVSIIGYFCSPLNVKKGSFDSGRFKLWKLSLKTFQEHPIAGIGLNNYYLSRHEMAGLRHAHNLFVNTAVERGLIGFVSLMIFIRGTLLTLWRTKLLKRYDNPYSRVVWFSALGAYIVVLVSGLFNTTLHHEHGILFTFFVGMLAANYKSELMMNDRFIKL